MDRERLKTLLAVAGWGLAGVLVYIGRQPPPVAREQATQEVVDTSKNTETTKQIVTKTEVKKTDGTTIVIEKTEGIITKVEEKSKTEKQETRKEIPALQPKPNHSVTVQFRPNFRTMTFKPHEFTYHYRLINNLWVGLGASTDKEALISLRYDF